MTKCNGKMWNRHLAVSVVLTEVRHYKCVFDRNHVGVIIEFDLIKYSIMSIKDFTILAKLGI